MSEYQRPSPEAATPEELFSTLDEAIHTMVEIALLTEYGFRFPNLEDFGITQTRMELIDARSRGSDS